MDERLVAALAGRMIASEPPPKVSVVMIFLDAEAFMEEAVESVLAQRFTDFELILVDDGSTDRSTAIAKAYADRFPGRIRYTDHERHLNLGMSASRNHGARLARGRFLSFLDSDDIWLPERLERFVEAIEREPRVGMVYGPTLYWYSWAPPREPRPGFTEPKDYAGWLCLPTNVLIPPPVPLREWLDTGGGCIPGINSLIIRREAFESVGGFEAEFRGLYEDQVFLSKMAARFPVMLIPDVLDYYRQHSGSSCHRGMETGDYHPERLHPARKRYLTWLEDYCDRMRVDDASLRRALRRQILPYRWKVIGLYHTARIISSGSMRNRILRHLPPWAVRRLRRIKNGLDVRTERLGKLFGQRPAG